MPFLKVINGVSAGQYLALADTRTILGRHPSCQIVLDNGAVSRQHAQINCELGLVSIEDLHSRNGTQVNGTSIRGRTELREGDRVQVCDYEFLYTLHAEKNAIASSDSSKHKIIPIVSGLRETLEDEDENHGTPPKSDSLISRSGTSEGSSVLASIAAGSSARGLRLNVRPEVKLRAVLEISAALGRLLKVEDVLPVILQSLFKIFAQADWGFVLLKDRDSDRLRVRASHSRKVDDDTDVPISMTVVRQAMHDGQAILSADVMGDCRFDQSESLSELRLRSLLCVPLTDTDGNSIGVIQLSTIDVSQPFNADDLDLLVSVSAQASLALENAELHDALVRQRENDRDMEIASQVQLGFLPSVSPKLDGYEFANFYESALSVGGDYFDYVPLRDGRVAVAVGDVAGKGVAAALLMARLHASGRHHLLSDCAAGRAMDNLNEEVANSGLGFRFITLAFAIIDPTRHEVTLSNAGHLPPLLRRHDGTAEFVGMEESGMPLGIMPDQKFEEITVSLQPGESLVLYTDGITEAMRSDEILYGKHRLQRAISACHESAGTLVKSLIADVESFCDGFPQRDDICVAVLRRLL